MKHILFVILFICSSSFALTLKEVQNELSKKAFSQDTIEMKIRTTVDFAFGKQVSDIHLVQKGASKIYMEMKSPLLNQKTLVSAGKIKTIDMNTREEKVLPYNGTELNLSQYRAPNLLESGEWKQPEKVSGNMYLIPGKEANIYYDSKLKQITKVIQTGNPESNTETDFTYDAVTKDLKTIKTTVDIGGVITSVLVEIQTLKSAKDFPDRFFEF
ncbi:MAG: hypothetical protein LBR60_09345 [Fibrobacter sp.]|jgi:outer membrane lipoprotein-sorting protein|nr:hypothetical protein [Fibrobacter sp.]